MDRQALLDAAIALAGSSDCMVTLEVNVTNDPALRLYARNGFRSEELLRGYYHDGSDALRMSLRIAGDPENSLLCSSRPTPPARKYAAAGSGRAP